MSEQDSRGFTTETSIYHGSVNPDGDFELVSNEGIPFVLHRHKWQPQKWEYEVVYFTGTLDHAANAHHLKELGEDYWELFKQVYLEAPADVTICTFKRPKIEDES